MSSDKSDVSMIHFNDKNYSAWAFHFRIFVKGKELWGVLMEVTQLLTKSKT
jgi:hypothetical protein